MTQKNRTIICYDIYRKKHEVRAENLVWRPSVYGVIIKNDKVLLVPQFGDGYDFPGGGIDIDETIQEALVREVREETGVAIKKLELAFSQELTFINEPLPVTRCEDEDRHNKIYGKSSYS